MHIAIIGAGAMGCLYGGYLSQENDVLLIDAYAPQVQALCEHGVTIEEGDRVLEFPVKAALSGTVAEPQDLVIVFVKTTQTLTALEENLALIGPNTTVLTLQNGLDNDLDLERFVPRERIVLGVSKDNSVGLGNGRVRHTFSGMTTVGPADKDITRSRKVADLLARAGFRAELSADVRRVIYDKLFINITFNTITFLLQTNVGTIATDPHAWAMARQVLDEALAVAAADGVPFDRMLATETLHKASVDAANAYTSMYQDRQRKARTEIDHLNGAVAARGRLLGVPTPCNALLTELVHAIENTYLPQ